MSIVNLDFGIKIVRSHVASEMRVRVPKEHIWYQNAKILQERFPVHFDAILTEVIRGDCKHYSPLHSKVGTVGAALKAQTYIRSSGQY